MSAARKSAVTAIGNTYMYSYKAFLQETDGLCSVCLCTYKMQMHRDLSYPLGKEVHGFYLKERTTLS